MADNSLHEQLHKYLTDTHAIEVQALAQLKRAPKIAGGGELDEMYAQHERETEDQKRLIEERYCVPTSLPWRMPWVGSWFSQKIRSISS